MRVKHFSRKVSLKFLIGFPRSINVKKHPGERDPGAYVISGRE